MGCVRSRRITAYQRYGAQCGIDIDDEGDCAPELIEGRARCERNGCSSNTSDRKDWDEVTAEPDATIGANKAAGESRANLERMFTNGLCYTALVSDGPR